MKADAVTMDLRIRSVAEWILMGFATKDIIAQCTAKWGVDERMAYKYRKAAFKIFHESRKQKINEKLDFFIAAKLKLFNELKDKDTPKGAAVANDILDSMAKMEGIMVDKLDVTSKGKQLKDNIRIIKATLNL